MPFTPEELEEMEKSDQEIEESFVLTNEEIAMAREYDKRAKYEAMTGDKQKVAAQQKAWYEANREKIAAQQKAYREANREKIAAQQKAYREANREKIAAQQKAYREANREKVAAQQKAYREANPKGKEVKPMERETVRRMEQALDGALFDIRETSNDDFRRLKMGEYRGLKIAAAVLGLVIRETEGRHTLMPGDAGQEEA